MVFQKILDRFGIVSLNDMQQDTINAAKLKQDLLLLAPTGSGKTLAFLLPVFTQLVESKAGVQALILVPSRELALQIEQVFKQMSTGFKVACCYGGHATKIEKNNLLEAPAVLIGTPGRIAYHVRNENFDASTVNFLVLDEFDKSLEFGFKDDMSFIISALPNLQQRFLTSATKMDDIPSFTGVKNIKEINYIKDLDIAPDLSLKAVFAEGQDKLDVLFLLICSIANKSALVFCNHRDAVDRISDLLSGMNILHGVFHGGLDQEDREKALLKFRNGTHQLLITTDLASRGLDIPEVAFVVHYQIPNTEDAYTHRNGRTARMKASGTVYFVMAENEHFPKFLDKVPERVTLERNLPLPSQTEWSTLYVAAGKKDKINKVDIVGLLLQKGKLQKEELGLIEVYDNFSYAAVKRSKIDATIGLIKNEKIKNKKVKIGVDE